ncbi:ABC transporter substrate-binding protein [Paenibacillus swuensis]|uniref:ABC transporter substrate-binding protein n=2 Tax=Paenibacillus swuensis TaxID=1178515 RepID=A0A172TPS7_9BACL|nr:ABC transporter substrate-binding protein [Paenibacillus swuensis]
MKYSVKIMLFVLCVSVTVLAGCEQQDGEPRDSLPEPQQEVRLDYWTPFSGGDNLFMTQMVDQFNKEHQGIQVVQRNSRLDDYYSRLRTAILSGNAPDVAVIHASSLPQFVQNGYIEELTEPARQVGLSWDQFGQAVRKSTEFNGKPYAVPLDTHALVMYYNKSYLKQAGVLDAGGKPVIAPGTQGFTAFLKKIKQNVPADVAPLTQPSTRIDSVWLWWSLYNQIQGGGVFFNPEGTKAIIDNKAAETALHYVNDLYRTGLVPAGINDAFKQFYDGKAAVFITGMWATGALEHVEELDFGVVPLPTLYDKPASWGDSHTLALPARHEISEAKRDASMIFTRWMIDHGAKWSEAGHVPSRTSVLQEASFQELKYRSDYAAAANTVAYWPKHTKQWALVELMIRQFEKMIYAQQTPEETLQKAVKLINLELLK